MMMATILMLLQEAVREVPRELPGGALAFMLISMGAVTSLTVWCFVRILSGRKHFDPDGTGPAHAPVPGEVEKAKRRPDR
jgi:hypothetical protein